MPNWENIGKSLTKAAGNGVLTVLTGSAERVSKNQNVRQPKANSFCIWRCIEQIVQWKLQQL